ncbi:hypothetical protein ACFLZE_03000 [Thermodesulfobacteriota bacterium]
MKEIKDCKHRLDRKKCYRCIYKTEIIDSPYQQYREHLKRNAELGFDVYFNREESRKEIVRRDLSILHENKIKIQAGILAWWRKKLRDERIEWLLLIQKWLEKNPLNELPYKGPSDSRALRESQKEWWGQKYSSKAEAIAVTRKREDWVIQWEKTNYESTENDVDRFGVVDYSDEADDYAEGKQNTKLEMVALYAMGRTAWDRLERWSDTKKYIVFPPPQSFKSWKDCHHFKREVLSPCSQGIDGYFYYDPFDTKKKIKYLGPESAHFKSTPKEKTDFICPNIWGFFPTDNDTEKIILEMYFVAKNKPVLIADYLELSMAYVSKVLKKYRSIYKDIIEPSIENMSDLDKIKLTKKIGRKIIFDRYLYNVKLTDIKTKTGYSVGYISRLFKPLKNEIEKMAKTPQLLNIIQNKENRGR